MIYNAILFLFFAVFYAAVGFGGGSGYIAILSFSDLPPSELRIIALFCNIIVVGGGTYLFFKHKLLPFKKVIPFVVTSVPAAFIGGTILLPNNLFFIVLASCLFLAGILMIVQPHKVAQPKSSNIIVNALIGAIIGFVSGLIGIGGGIFLAPILYLMRWDKAKIIAATASFFILVNSISGLVGQYAVTDVQVSWKILLPLLIAVGIGGQVGSRLNINGLSQLWVKRLTAVLVIFASVRIFYKLLV
ncbi:MAG: putative membrane protein YfcA [bacterium]